MEIDLSGGNSINAPYKINKSNNSFTFTVPIHSTSGTTYFEIEDDQKEPGTIVQEIQKGFTIKDRLLRPALVGVAKKSEKKEEKNEENKENSGDK